MTEWTDLTQGEVRRWRGAGFGPGEAVAWREAGVTVPADARLWSTAAATPARSSPGSAPA
ncbi:hypothetical protein ACFQ0B_66295 [Nonomuraea thailandensis]